MGLYWMRSWGWVVGVGWVVMGCFGYRWRAFLPRVWIMPGRRFYGMGEHASISSVLFITLISMLSIHPRLLGCSVLFCQNCDAVAAAHVVPVPCAFHAFSPKKKALPSTQSEEENSIVPSNAIAPFQCNSTLFNAHPLQCKTLTTPPSTPNSRHILSIVFPISSASLAPDPIRCS